MVRGTTAGAHRAAAVAAAVSRRVIVYQTYFDTSRPCAQHRAGHRNKAMSLSGLSDSNKREQINRNVDARKRSLSSYSQSVHSMSEKAKPQVIVVTGPTAAGKTLVGIELACKLDGEVVSADSVQVYKGLNIGTGKVTEEAKRGIPHHLIDIYKPEDDFSAGDFTRAARKCIAEIVQRGKTPIVVGGTGFYLRWLIYGIPGTPKSTELSIEKAKTTVCDAMKQVRDGMNREMSSYEAWDVAVQVLRDLGDSKSADSIPRNNYYQLYRAIEIIQMTGTSKKSFQLPHVRTNTSEDLASTVPVDEIEEDSMSLEHLGYDVRGFVLSPPRIFLYEIIDKRVEEIMYSGILKECALLAMKGLSSDSHSSTRAIGYRQCLQLFERVIARNRNENTPVTSEDIKDCLLAIMSATRNLASKQLSWHRGDRMWKWHPCVKGQKRTVSISDISEDILNVCQQPRDWPTEFDVDLSHVSKEEVKELRRFPPSLYKFRRERELSDLKSIVDHLTSVIMNKDKISSR